MSGGPKTYRMGYSREILAGPLDIYEPRLADVGNFTKEEVMSMAASLYAVQSNWKGLYGWRIGDANYEYDLGEVKKELLGEKEEGPQAGPGGSMWAVMGRCSFDKQPPTVADGFEPSVLVPLYALDCMLYTVKDEKAREILERFNTSALRVVAGTPRTKGSPKVAKMADAIVQAREKEAAGYNKMAEALRSRVNELLDKAAELRGE